MQFLLILAQLMNIVVMIYIIIPVESLLPEINMV